MNALDIVLLVLIGFAFVRVLIFLLCRKKKGGCVGCSRCCDSCRGCVKQDSKNN